MTATAIALFLLAAAPTQDAVDKLYPQLDPVYCELHQNPELSHHEVKTGKLLADRLKKLGYEVTSGVGKTGVVAVLKNGAGPTLTLRTDLDALPVEEKTGAPYASHVHTVDDQGQQVGVMHACGHDIHMTTWLGAATLLAEDRKSWSGTLVLVGQPAEEKGEGARGMIDDGLFKRFPKPDYALALHDTAALPSGKVGFVPGYVCANVDSVDITFYGRGGHGAFPHLTVDPIVIASRFVMDVQTLVSREENPFEPAVVTVGSFHAGTKHNIIADEAKLQLTVRSYKPDVRKKLLAGIERIARAAAQAADAPKPPDVKFSEPLNATYNDPKLTERLKLAIAKAYPEMGTDAQPVMGAEDFGEWEASGIPSMLLWVGAVDPKKYETAKKTGESLPAAHSALFLPDHEATVKTGIRAYLAMVRELLPANSR